MKTVIFGGNGFIGGYFKKLYPEAKTPSVDIADREKVQEILDTEKPDVVINCAGKTGKPNVDWCEDHKEETLHSNVTGPLVLLEECLARNIYLVQLGSGCIYQGDESHPFTEEDEPNFFGSFYSRTKGWTDQILKDFPVLQLRLRMPFDGSNSPRSLITKLSKYERVLDVRNSLTYIPDLLEAAKKLIEKRKTGIYNIVNPGPLSPYEIMQKYTEIVDPSHTFEKLTLEDLSDVVKAGRSNCVLSTAKLENEGITMRPSSEALDEALRLLQ